MQSFHQDIMDCPNCGKRGLIRQTSDIYQCLCCGFKRNLSEPGLEDKLVWAVITLILSTLVLGNWRTEEPFNNSQPESTSINSLSGLVESGRFC